MSYNLYDAFETNELDVFSDLTIHTIAEQFGQKTIPSSSKLSHLLANYTKNTLMEWAEINCIEFRKSWTKQTIVELAAERVTDTLEIRLLSLTKEQYTLYKTVVFDKKGLKRTDPRTHHLFMINALPVIIKLGLAFMTIKGKQLTLTFPDEVTELLESETHLKNEPLSKKLHSIRTILKAGINLYGVIDISAIVRLHQIFYPEIAVEEIKIVELYHYVSPLAITHDYYILDYHRMANVRFDNEVHAAYYAEALGNTAPDSRYQPTKKEIIFYAENDFDRRLEPYKKLVKLIHQLTDDVEFAIDVLETHALMGSRMSILMDEMNETDLLVFSTDKEAEKFAFLYYDLLRQTRQWQNYGFTLKEYQKDIIQSEPILSMAHMAKHRIPETNQTIKRQTVKVGRNDPCPCGSGLKYKKCCGR